MKTDQLNDDKAKNGWDDFIRYYRERGPKESRNYSDEELIEMLLEELPEYPSWKTFIPVSPDDEWGLCAMVNEETGEYFLAKERISKIEIPNSVRIPKEESYKLNPIVLNNFISNAWGTGEMVEIVPDNKTSDVTVRRIAA